MDRPLIGITCDVVRPEGSHDRPRMVAALAYAQAIERAGGMPVVLAPIAGLLPHYLAMCRGFVLTGGDDPAMEPFGQPTHPLAKPIDPIRQSFETELLQTLLNDRSNHGDRPVLGVCLGMQMMALVAGGDLNQHLPDDCQTAWMHHPNVSGGEDRSSANGDRTHTIHLEPSAREDWGGLLPEVGAVASHHRQAVRDPGRLRVLARSPDGLIEAIGSSDPADAERPFRLGVQWHPERTSESRLGSGLFESLVAAARRAN